MNKVEYSFDDIHSLITCNYISHHGILGQKHGERNGTNYPLKPGEHSAEEMRLNNIRFDGNERKGLFRKKDKTKKDGIKDYRSMSEDEVDKSRKDAIRRGDVKEVNKNREFFTDNDINAALNRYDLNKRLSDYSQKDVKSALDKFQDAMNKVDKVKNGVDKAYNAYLSVAKIVNTFLGDDEKKLPVPNNNNNNNKNNKNNNQKKDINDPSWNHYVEDRHNGKVTQRTTYSDGNVIKEHFDSSKEQDKSKHKKENKSK